MRHFLLSHNTRDFLLILDKTILSTIILTVITSTGFVNVYADEIIAVTLDLQTILLDVDEVIPLLNTNNIANMSKVTVSATLPCNSSNVPSLTISAGVLGNTSDVIDSSSDYQSLRGPFDTCYFEDTIDISNNTVPALNRVFLINDGSSSVLTSLGTTVTLTGIFEDSSTIPSQTIVCASGADFCEDFSGYASQVEADASWLPTHSIDASVNLTNQTLNFDFQQDGVISTIYHDLGSTLDDTQFVLRYVVHFNTLTEGSFNKWHFWLSSVTEDNADTSTQSGTNVLGWVYKHRATAATGIGHVAGGGIAATSETGWEDDKLSINTDYYVEFKRTSATAASVTVRTGNHTGTTVMEDMQTIASGIQDLRYLKLDQTATNDDGVAAGYVDDIEIWDGVSSVP